MDARETLQVTSDAKVIAAHTMRDSAAVKILTVVAIMFLPGGFVASLFSMPVLDWDGRGGEGGPVLKAGFKIYLAIALPLTLLIVLIYNVWSIWYSWKEMRKCDLVVVRKGVDAVDGEK